MFIFDSKAIKRGFDAKKKKNLNEKKNNFIVI